MISDYLEGITRLASSVEELSFNSILNEIKRAAKHRHTIFLIGNGSNAITVSHFANDLMKNSGEKTARMLEIGIKVLSLTDNMPFFTAVSNDISLNKVYAEYLRTYSDLNDLVVIFSSGLPHENLVEAAKYAYQKGIRVVAITGSQPGELDEYSHVNYKIESNSPEMVEGVQMFLCHSLAVKLREELAQPVVFLDRDGVININRADYVKNWDEFEFLPGVAQAIGRLNQKGYAVIVVTNQSAVGRGIMSTETLEEIHCKMQSSLIQSGARINKIYFCPHTPYDNCSCRKPKTGMLEKAYGELPIDIEKGIMIGDRFSDIEAGRNFGLTTILLTNNKKSYEKTAIAPHYFADNLPAAVELIMGGNFSYAVKPTEYDREADCI